MYYLVQAMEEHTDRVLPSFTKLFNSKEPAYAYARKIVADKCGFDFAEITRLECDSDQFELCSEVRDPLAGLSAHEYELATCLV